MSHKGIPEIEWRQSRWEMIERVVNSIPNCKDLYIKDSAYNYCPFDPAIIFSSLHLTSVNLDFGSIYTNTKLGQLIIGCETLKEVILYRMIGQRRWVHINLVVTKY